MPVIYSLFFIIFVLFSSTISSQSIGLNDINSSNNNNLTSSALNFVSSNITHAPTLLPSYNTTTQPSTTITPTLSKKQRKKQKNKSLKPTTSPSDVTLSPTNKATYAPTMAPVSYPTSLPTKEIKIYSQDLTAWEFIFDSLNGNNWISCNDARDDPCSCSYIKCSVFNISLNTEVFPNTNSPGRLRSLNVVKIQTASSTLVLRIVEMKMNNNNLVGLIPVDSLMSLPALKKFDISNDSSGSNKNRILIVGDTTLNKFQNWCKSLDQCNVPQFSTDLTSYLTKTPTTSSSTSTINNTPSSNNSKDPTNSSASSSPSSSSTSSSPSDTIKVAVPLVLFSIIIISLAIYYFVQNNSQQLQNHKHKEEKTSSDQLEQATISLPTKVIGPSRVLDRVLQEREKMKRHSASANNDILSTINQQEIQSRISQSLPNPTLSRRPSTQHSKGSDLSFSVPPPPPIQPSSTYRRPSMSKPVDAQLHQQILQHIQNHRRPSTAASNS